LAAAADALFKNEDNVPEVDADTAPDPAAVDAPTPCPCLLRVFARGSKNSSMNLRSRSASVLRGGAATGVAYFAVDEKVIVEVGEGDGTGPKPGEEDIGLDAGLLDGEKLDRAEVAGEEMESAAMADTADPAARI